MITTFNLRNFRVFGDTGAAFNISPITILTGCNSSGKSSVVKAITLMSRMIDKTKEQYKYHHKYNPFNCYLDFSDNDLNLKSFDSAVNRDNPNEMTISYTACGFLCNYNVEIHFSRKEDDIFNYGWIDGITISMKDEDLLKVSQGRKSLHVDYLNLNAAQLLSEFKVVAQAAMFIYITTQMNEFVDPEYGMIIDENNYSIWEHRKKEFIKKCESSQYLRPVLYSIQKLRDCPIKNHDKLFNKDFEKALDILMKDNIMLYFPVLERFRDVSKEEAIEIILSAETDDINNQDGKFKELAQIIAMDFKASEFESFIDYYRNWENIELNDVAASQQKAMSSELHFVKLEDNFIDSLSNDIAGIHYNEGSGIRLLSSYDYDRASFGAIYQFLTKWQVKEGRYEDFITAFCTPSGVHSQHNLYEAYTEFLSLIMERLLIPDLFQRFSYVGNFQSSVKRLYSFDDTTNNLGNTLKVFLANGPKLIKLNESHKMSIEKQYRPGDFTNKWLRKLDICTSLNIIEDEDGLGAKIYLRDGAKRKSRPLADEGYGISQLVTFLLQIENEIIRNQITRQESFFMLEKNDDFSDASPTISLEEPEVSLHPSMQSRLADIFYDAYKNYGIHFIIETHSEYLIRRTQAIVSKYKSEKEHADSPFSVYYIDKGGKSYQLKYTESGRFDRPFGKGFFDEASRSSIEILKKEKKMNYGKNGKLS